MQCKQACYIEQIEVIKIEIGWAEAVRHGTGSHGVRAVAESITIKEEEPLHTSTTHLPLPPTLMRNYSWKKMEEKNKQTHKHAATH